MAPELGSSDPDGMKARPFLSHLHKAYLNRPPPRRSVPGRRGTEPTERVLSPAPVV